MPLLPELFLTFAKVGLFTFGGGYAMISLISDICVEKKKWITHDEMMELTVIAESTPGPIAINAATYVGYKQAGLIGSVVTTVALVLPSFVIIYLISTVLDNFLEIMWVANAFKGIKIGVGLLILRVAMTMLKQIRPKPMPRVIAGCAFAVMLAVNFLSLKFSSISLLILAGAAGLGAFLVMERKGGAKE
jgi:chromate transporter